MRTSIFLLAVLVVVGCDDINTNPVESYYSNSLLPHVAIEKLADGDIVRKDIYGINVEAYHKSGIEFVQLKIGLKDIHIDYTEPYSFVWRVDEAEGMYTICALALGKNGSTNRHCIEVEVKY
jgi:hypothetical protein